jgi:hypothetical protein
MARSEPSLDTPGKAASATLARALAPEDIGVGDFVAVLHEITEWPSWFWCDNALVAAPSEVVQIRYLPRDDAVALKVESVCLPFVLVKLPCGERRTVDVRRHRLARLGAKFAKAARRACRRQLKRAKGRQRGGK